MEKRRSKRHARRLKVRFGEADTAGFPGSGLTNDVSTTGLFVVASMPPKPGTRLHVEITLPGERPLYVEGVVARQALVPPELRQVIRGGFGVRFLTGPELMAELIPGLTPPKKDDPFTLTFQDAASLRTAIDREFVRGGVFIWSPRAVTQNTIVSVTFELRFIDRRLVFEARIVHAMPSADGRFGVALMFVDPAAALSALNSVLS